MQLRNVIFYVNDIKSAKSFYENIGFEMLEDFGQFISYRTDAEGIYFSIMQPDDETKVPGKQVCTFWTDDIKILFQQMLESDVEIATELSEEPFGETFAIRDPDGNKIEFVESRE